MAGNADTVNRTPLVDFDPNSPEYAAHGPEILRRMRTECPRAWSEKHGGFWVATKYNDVLRIAQSPELFGTAKTVDMATGKVHGGVAIPSNIQPRQIPLEVDNPEHKTFRDFLNPNFAPRAAEAHRAFVQGVARTLVDRVIETGEMDIVDDLASPLPAIFTMNFLGLDLNGWRRFADPVHKWIFTSPTDPEFQSVNQGISDILVMLADGAADRRKSPRDDLLSRIANGVVDGRPITESECVEIAFIVITGGVDTTTALTSNALRHLGQFPEKRQRLIDEPALIPTAREEFVRYFTPVQGPGRNARCEVNLDGWHFMPKDRVLLSYAAANRDPEIFSDPEELKIDRFPNRHFGFGAGMHRCMGSFFARVMFESMLNEVLARLPDYKLVKSAEKQYPVAALNGWIHVPITFTPGPRLGNGIQLS